ncbi:glycosyltransferase family 39 protein, partial [bacterium]|nr:glycosyltransferase family 39 protein [bacterium]
MKTIVTTSSRNPLLIFWIALFAIILIVYATQHPPIKFIVLNIAPMIAAFCLMASITGFGSIPVMMLLKERNVATKILTSLALGIGITGIFIGVLGFIGLFRIELFVIWILLGAGLFIFAIYSWSPQFSFSYRFSRWDLLAVAALVLFLIPGLPFFVSPEVSRDATEYHLLIPATWLKLGRISYIPLLVESNYPPLAQLIYLIVFRLSGEIACKCVHFVMATALMLLLSQISKRLSPQSSPYLAPLTFVTMPVVYVLAGWAWNDLFFSFFVLLSIYFLIEFHIESVEKRNSTNVVFAGISMGLAAATKYTFILYLPAIFLLILIGIFRWQWHRKTIILFLIPVGLLSSLWMMKNWAFTGNPVYPFLNGIFQSPYWTENADGYLKATLNRSEIGNWSWSTYFLFPFILTLKPQIIDVHTGVLPLMFALLILRKNRSETERILKWSLVLSMLSWFVFQTIIRSLIPILAIVFCLGAAALQELNWESSRLRRITAFLVGIAVAMNVYIAMVSTYHLFDPFRYFIGLESKAQYLSRMSTGQQVYDELNRIKDVKQVLLVSLHNPLYLRPRPIFSSCCDPPVAEALTAGTPNAAAIADKMKRLGISHVAVDKVTYNQEHEKKLYSWSKEDQSRFEDFLLHYCVDIGR